MSEDKKKHQQPEDEAAQANQEIQEQFNEDDAHSDETSSPVPFVANNTAPIAPVDKNKKK